MITRLPLGLLLGIAAVLEAHPAHASYVALMAGQTARPLNGSFNTVPVLHSNQPEEVEGPGILISTAPGMTRVAETGQSLTNAEYTFNGEFGLHMHHKYFPASGVSYSSSGRRSELSLGAILINPSSSPVHLRFQTGAVRNSFEAPYLANQLMGVKPLGQRPWNTGPGDATAVQMLRGKLDFRLSEEITIPPYSRIVLFSTQLPALGIANALLKGRSDGPFQMAVVAAKNPRTDADYLAVLDQGILAPGRVYLSRLNDIENRRIFSRVGGVAIGDSYKASISHDLTTQGPLHVPFTSTSRTHFGTRDVQVNPLASRMMDSSLDNVGTYGVRFDVDLNLQGQGPYELVLSHPMPVGGRPFTAFRGSLQIQTEEGLKEVHVGLRSGESLSLIPLQLRGDGTTKVRISLVYPADATPGHLLSVVPTSQLAQVRDRERLLDLARSTPVRPTLLPNLPPVELPQAAEVPQVPGVQPPQGWGLPDLPALPPINQSLPSAEAPDLGSGPLRGATSSLIDRYRQAAEEQQRRIRDWQSP